MPGVSAHAGERNLRIEFQGTLSKKQVMASKNLQCLVAGNSGR